MRALWTILGIITVAGGGYWAYNYFMKASINIESVDWLTKSVKYDMRSGQTSRSGVATASGSGVGSVGGPGGVLSVQAVLGNLVFTIRKNDKIAYEFP